MSIVDETPNYYIEGGKLYHYTPGEYILSGGFNVGPDSKKEELGEATPELINEIIKDKNLVRINNFGIKRSEMDDVFSVKFDGEKWVRTDFQKDE